MTPETIHKNKYRSILYHVLGWTIYFVTQYLILTSYHVKPNLLYQSGVWLLSLLIFYINYFYLIPKYFFRNRSVIYSITVVVLLTGIYFVNQQWSEHFKPIQKKVETETLEQEHNEIRNFYHYKRKLNIMSIYGFLFFFAASTAIRMIQKWNENEKIQNEQEKQKVTAELAFLKKQVNPHFLFNSLNSIYSLANKQSEQTVEAILKLSHLLRYMLYETDCKTVYLNNETEHIENYIALQKYRLNEKTKVKFDIEGDTKQNVIEPLLLIALVENAFKYGADNVHESMIRINLSVNNNELRFTATNTIVQKASELNGEKSGIGLNNIKRRLQLSYPDAHSLEITKEGDTFKVVLFLKLKK